MTEWEQAQKWEAEWWRVTCRNCVNTFEEEKKQLEYAEKMGLEVDDWSRIDLGSRSVIDIGGGPVSLLLKTTGGIRLVLDPLVATWPHWVYDRYRVAGIDVLNARGEDPLDLTQFEEEFDEAWIYNCLQHVEDPEAVIANAFQVAKVIRIHEWINTGVSDGHLHTLTVERLQEALHTNGGAIYRKTFPNGTYVDAFYGVFERPSSSGVFVSHGSSLVFHLPGLNHTQTNKNFLSCAYTQKVYKLSKMLSDLGYEVIHYGVEGSDPVCSENVSVVSNEERIKQFPQNDDRTQQYTYDTTCDYHRKYDCRVVEEIRKRLGRRNFLLCSWGFGHKSIADQLGNKVIPVESGIGYADTWSDYRVFESYSWMHYVYGLGKLVDGVRQPQSDGGWYDAVIPNFFDLDDFKFRPTHDNYLLYLGRIVRRKGVELAVEIAERTKQTLIIAGQGTLQNPAEGLDLRGDCIGFVGYADAEKRREILAGAKAVLMPTYYIEPFGGVAVEAQLSGTPVITTDWGAFAETVLHGRTGFRCRNFAQFCDAVERVDSLDRYATKEWASENYSCERVAQKYKAYFEMLLDSGNLEKGKDWYSKDARITPDWLTTYYP